MKTNATSRTVTQAVENVSKRQFEGNLVFRSTPEKLTKNVIRFTIKTLRADKPGSLTNKLGVTMAKANWEAHQAVMYEILKLDARPHIYVDTVYGRQYSSFAPQVQPVQEPVLQHAGDKDDEDEHITTRVKRKYTKRNQNPLSDIETNLDVMNIVNAIRYILTNPTILSVK